MMWNPRYSPMATLGSGMMSGQVWYHTWHGAFISSSET
jgi:hypothetical protein